MATIRDPEHIYQKMREGFKFYRVFDSDGKTILDTNQDEGTSQDEAIQSLAATINNIDGLITVEISKKNGKATNAGGDNIGSKLKYTLKVGNYTETKSAGINGAGGGSFAGNFEMVLNLMREVQAKDMQILTERFEAEKRIKNLLDLQNNGNGYQDQMIGFAIKKLDKMFPDMPAAPIPVAGTRTQPSINGTGEPTPEATKIEKIQMTPEQNQQLQLAVHTLLSIDAQFLQNITNLATLAKEQPEVYQLAINKLNAFL